MNLIKCIRNSENVRLNQRYPSRHLMSVQKTKTDSLCDGGCRTIQWKRLLSIHIFVSSLLATGLATSNWSSETTSSMLGVGFAQLSLLCFWLVFTELATFPRVGLFFLLATLFGTICCPLALVGTRALSASPFFIVISLFIVGGPLYICKMVLGWRLSGTEVKVPSWTTSVSSLMLATTLSACVIAFHRTATLVWQQHAPDRSLFFLLFTGSVTVVAVGIILLNFVWSCLATKNWILCVSISFTVLGLVGFFPVHVESFSVDHNIWMHFIFTYSLVFCGSLILLRAMGLRILACWGVLLPEEVVHSEK